MYPSTTFIIEDRTAVNRVDINEQISAPLFLQAFASDKGPEEMGVYYGEEFIKTFGSPNFAKYGQPLTQAQTLINNGARVWAKRIVSPSATLGNLIISAKVSKTSVQKKDSEGLPLYLTAEGEETTEADGNTPITTDKCHVEYELSSVEGNLNDINDLKSDALTLADYEGKSATEVRTYPLFLVTDNGRGVSTKKFKITANTAGSRTGEYLTYVFSVIEDSVVVETTLFTLNPDITDYTSNLSLTSKAKSNLKEVKAFCFDDVVKVFLEDVKNTTGIENVDNIDVLFGRTKNGITLSQFEVAGDVNLAIPTGLGLQNGTNGTFTSTPINSEDFNQVLTQFFNGTLTDEIYDVNNYLLDAIIDADYPDQVKRAIESLVDFREDAVFFEDLGIGLNTVSDIVARASNAANSRYVALYCNSYDIIDIYSKKQVTVTAGYGLARKLPEHFAERRNSPLAGQLNNFVFDDIVEGTLNFSPKIIPGLNQKHELFDNHINFIAYTNNLPVLESEYTHQTNTTGFSYINNVLATQAVVKAIRERCPANRYAFMEEDDLERYKDKVQLVLNRYLGYFSSIEFEYAGDASYEQNMTFYGVLYVTFKTFVQAEVFRVIAINKEDIVAI